MYDKNLFFVSLQILKIFNIKIWKYVAKLFRKSLEKIFQVSHTKMSKRIALFPRESIQYIIDSFQLCNQKSLGSPSDQLVSYKILQAPRLDESYWRFMKKSTIWRVEEKFTTSFLNM